MIIAQYIVDLLLFMYIDIDRDRDSVIICQFWTET